jgi:hypothetical protein
MSKVESPLVAAEKPRGFIDRLSEVAEDRAAE